MHLVKWNVNSEVHVLWHSEISFSRCCFPSVILFIHSFQHDALKYYRKCYTCKEKPIWNQMFIFKAIKWSQEILLNSGD